MYLRHAATILFTIALGACASGSRLEEAPNRKENLTTWIEKVHIEAGRSRDSIAESYERLQMLASGEYPQGDAAMAYAQFVQSIDIAETQATRFREVVEPLASAAAPVFEQWAQDVQTIGNERLRTRGELSMTVSKERYEAVLASANDAREQFNGFVQDLRDHAAFLAHDLNPRALDEIQEDVKMVRNNAEKLDQELDRTLTAARAYVDLNALPAQGSPASPNR